MEIFIGVLIVLVALGMLLTHCMPSLFFPAVVGIFAILINIVVTILSAFYLPLWITIFAGIAVVLDIVVFIARGYNYWWKYVALLLGIGAWTAVAVGCFMGF